MTPNEMEHGEACADVGCASCHTHHEEQFDWKEDSIPIIIALVFAGIGYILEHSFAQSNLIFTAYIAFLISYFIVSWEIIETVYHNLKQRVIFDENFLMFIATIGAILTNNYVEAIAVIIFYRIGEMVENYSVSRSKKSISALLETRPDIANVKTVIGIEQRKPQQVCIGEIIVVKPGERVPLDGIMLSESSSFDTSVLTGESIPRKFHRDQQVLAGTVNLTDQIEIRVIKNFENSAISRILDLVQNAQSQKSPTERFITKFARIYTPIVVFAAAIIALIPPLVIPGELFITWLYRSMIFLVISCPCALVLSIPLTYFGGIGGASRNGVLVKGSNHLDALAKLKTIVFDKTGTITKGNFKVTEVIPVNGYTSEQLLETVATAESGSTHPIAKSIRDAYGKSINGNHISQFKEIPAHGIQATVQNKEIIAGNDKILHRFDVAHQYHFCDLSGTIVHVAIDRNYVGYLIISDEIKEDSHRAMKDLHKLGVEELVMLSGDDSCIVEDLAEKLGIKQYHSNLLPEDKVKQVEKLQTRGNSVAFVGDGINDAPVIASADVGIAMGAFGSDAAIESADIVLMTDSLTRVGAAIQIARKSLRIIWENIIAIFSIKVLFLILGAIGLMTMWGAVFADVGLTVLAVLNARRVLNYKPTIN